MTNVPDWLDLDRLVAPELRAEPAAVTTEVLTVAPRLKELGGNGRPWPPSASSHALKRREGRAAPNGRP